MKIDSLKEIAEAVKGGADVIVGKGFHDRDCKISKSEFMIAFGFHGTTEPGGGGTAATWKACKSKNKIYVNITRL
jgi:hypothetical protein